MHELATGKGDVRGRLLGAFNSIHTLNDEDFPEEFRKDWAWIMNQLTKAGPILDNNGKVWRGSAENTLSKIRNATGTKIANKIFEIGWDLHANENADSTLNN
jgi:hypothetical protein